MAIIGIELGTSNSATSVLRGGDDRRLKENKEVKAC